MDKSAVSLCVSTRPYTYKLYLKQQGDSLKGKSEYLIWDRVQWVCWWDQTRDHLLEQWFSLDRIVFIVWPYLPIGLWFILSISYLCMSLYALLTLCAVPLKSSLSSSFHLKGFLKSVKNLCDSFFHNEKIQSQKNNKIHFTWTRSLSYLFNYTEIYPWIEWPWMLK